MDRADYIKYDGLSLADLIRRKQVSAARNEPVKPLKESKFRYKSQESDRICVWGNDLAGERV